MNKLLPDDVVLKFYDKNSEIPQTAFVDSKLVLPLIANLHDEIITVSKVNLKKPFPVKLFIQGSNEFNQVASKFQETISNIMRKFNFIPKKGIINYDLPNFNIDYQGFEKLQPRSYRYTLECINDMLEKLAYSLKKTIELGKERHSACLENSLTYNFSRNGSKCESLHFAYNLFKYLIQHQIVISLKINSEEPIDAFYKDKEKLNLLFYLEKDKLHLVLYIYLVDGENEYQEIDSPHIDYAEVILRNLADILFKFEHQKLIKALEINKFGPPPNINETRPLAFTYEDSLNLLQQTLNKIYPDIAAGSIR